MNYQDIEIPLLFGGVDEPVEKNSNEVISDTNPITMKNIETKLTKASSYFSNNSSLFIIIIASIVVMFIVHQANHNKMSSIMENSLVAIVFFGALSIVATCLLLMFTGYGSDKDITENLKKE